jgi:hypothetical protein
LLLEQGFEFGDHFKVFGSAGGSLHANERLQVKAQTSCAECVKLNRMIAEVLVAAAPDNLAEKVDVSQRCC